MEKPYRNREKDERAARFGVCLYTSINALAYDAPDDTNAVIEEAEKMLFNVTQKRVSSSFQNITDLLTQAFDDIDELVNNKSHMAGVPTGFTDVDKLFWGLRGGDLRTLAARPGVGKTSFALNLATNAAKSGAAVAMFSLEMGANQACPVYLVRGSPRQSWSAESRQPERRRLERHHECGGNAVGT